MKKLFAVAVYCLSAAALNAQDKPAASPAENPGEARIRALESQVGALAEQLAALRSELQEMRDAKGSVPVGANTERVLLTSSHIEPGMLPAASAPDTASTSAIPAAVQHAWLDVRRSEQ